MDDEQVSNRRGRSAVVVPAVPAPVLPLPQGPLPSSGALVGGGPAPPRLLDRVREAIRIRHYSPRTEKAYVGWIKRYIFFHGKRHPDEMGAPDVTRFLSSLAIRGQVSAGTQNQAFSALLFLYREVLRRELVGLDETVRAKRPVRVPLVLTHEEVCAVLRHIHGTPWLMAALMYGAGLRLLECARLRVKDVDFSGREIKVRDGKGRKDRTTLLPGKLVVALRAHLDRVYQQHQSDLKHGRGSVELPAALARKYPRAAFEWPWQWVFPAKRFYLDTRSGQRRRHHLHESVLQKALERLPFAPRVSPNLRPLTRCVTASRLVCSRRATTSGPSRSSWATATSAPP